MGRTEERIGVILDIKGDVNKIKSSIGSLQKDLLGVQLPKGLGKDFETRMRRLSDEIENFEKLASKAGNSFEGAKQIDSSYKKILEYARKVEISFSAIKKEANIDTSKFFPKEILERIEKAEAAVANYEKAIEKGNDALQKQKKSLKDIEAALSKNEKKRVDLISDKDSKKATYDKVKKEQGKVKTTKSNELAQEQKNLEILKQKKIALDAEKAAVEDLAKKKKALEKSEKDYSSRKAQYGANDSKAKGEKQKLNADKKAYEEALQAAKKYGDTIRSISDIELDQSKTASSIDATKTAIKGLGKEIDAADDKIKKAQNAFDTAAQDLRENETAAKSLQGQMATLKSAIEQAENAAKAKGLKELVKSLDEIGVKIDPATSSLEDIQKTINNLKPDAIKAIADALDKAGVNLDELDVDLTNLGRKNTVFQESAKGAKEMSNQLDQLKGHIQQFFSLTNSVMLFRRGIQQAIETVKELDKAMTETAVVTDFSVGDMWDALPRYTQAANELGATTLGAYETMTLFYQQGLKTNEAFEIGTETMKMARIAGLDYANATNLMTAALRGFNMELNNASASKINDVYSELAAITAADTNEIASAMTKTASIANSANMEFETTAALLSQIIETTREPAETAGTALKTIIARFTEMKKATSDIVSVEGEEVSVNKVEAALKSAGVALRDVNGEFRDLDDVFLELSSKWNGLDMMTQRYIATMAAGSRQQSRFIAMMQDYERTIELVDAAYNSSGASQRQFEKTQESLESKLNKLKNAWDEFLMGISNSTIIKKGVDALTGLLNVINKLTGNSGIGKLLVAISALKGGSAIFNNLFNASNFGKAFSEKFGFDASKLIDLKKMGTATEKLKGFSETVTGMTGKGILEAIKNGLGGIGKTALETGKSFWNLGKAGLGAGKSLIGGIGKALVALGPWGAAAAVAIAAVGAALYELWYNSGLQTAKRQAEADAATLKETQDYVSGLTEKVRELDDAWESLTEGQNNLDGLVEGTIEWTEQVQALNEEVQALLQKYPELYKYLNIDQNTGQWSLDKTGYTEYQATTKKEQKEAKNRELYETAISNYSTGLYDLIEKSAQDDNLWNYLYGYGDEAYSDEIKKFYLKQKDSTFDGQGIYQKIKDTETAPSVEAILEGSESVEIRRQINDSNSKQAKASLKYYDEKIKLDKQLKSEESAYIKNYLATSGKYSKKTQDAVTQTMYKLPSSFETLQEQRGKYAGDTRGKGAKMQGEAKEGEEKTVEQIMKARGYELIDNDKNWYKNNITGKYVNVDSVGGGVAGEEVKKKTVNGEEVTMETWSNEYVRDLGRQDVLRSQQEENMKILGDTFAEDINLAKMAAGDLSADLTQIGADFKKDIKNGEETLFDYSETRDNFVNTRSKTMDELNERYNNAFQSTGSQRIRGEEIKKYTQSTYEAAQATLEFEETVEALGTETKQNLTSIFLAFKDLEEGVELNIDGNLDEETKKLVEGYNKAGISADKLQDYVNKIDMSSAINGAQQLKRDLEEGGQEAMLAATVISSDKLGSQFFSVGNQFKELIAGEQWLEKTQASLTEIYKLEGQITADNIRELAEENSDLAAVLDTNSLKASGFAKMMEAVESGTISLTDVTSDLIEVYDGLYYSADLAGEAIARLESAKIKESDTKVGNIYSESYGAVKDLMKRGAYGDTQIDDYMNQMLGGSAWADALANAKGNKQDAVNAINKQYGLSANKGNLYGSWKKQIINAGGSIAGGAIKMGADGSISYDLSNIQSTQQLVEKIMEDTGVTKEYAEAMLGDMKTYSTTLGTDLEKLDKIGTLNDFVNSRTTKDGVLNMSEAEKASFAQARGQTVDEFEKDLLANEKINSLEDRKYSDSGYYYTTEDEEGNRTVKFTDAEIEDGAKNQLIDEIKKTTEEGFTEGTNEAFEGIENLEDLQAKLEVELAAGGGPLTEETINSLIGVDSVREIMLDPNLDDTQKQDLLNQILTPTYAGAANGLAQGLLGQESMANAQAIADYMGVEMYNKMGAQLTQAMDLLATHKVEIPFSFSGLNVTLPSNAFTDALGFGGKTITLLGSGGVGSKFVIGGSGTGLSSSFSGKSSSYTPKTVNVGGITGGQTGGKGNAYTKGNDNANDPTQSGSNSSGNKDKNTTNSKLKNVDQQLEDLDRKREKGEINALEYQTQRNQLLTTKHGLLETDLNSTLSQAKGAVYYDKKSDSVKYNNAAYNKLSDEDKTKVDKIYEEAKKICTDMNKIEDEVGSIERNQSNDTTNEDEKLKALERDRKNGKVSAEEYQQQKKELLTSKYGKLTSEFNYQLANNPENEFFKYDAKTDTLQLNEKKYNQLSDDRKKEVKSEFDDVNKILEEMNTIEDQVDELNNLIVNDTTNNKSTQEALDRQLERGKIGVGDYSSKMLESLENEQSKLQNQFNDKFSKSADKAFFKYDKALDTLLIDEDKLALLNEEQREAVLKEYETLKGINDQLNDVEDSIKEAKKYLKYDTTNTQVRSQALDEDYQNGNMDPLAYQKAKVETNKSENRSLRGENNSIMNEMMKDVGPIYFNKEEKQFKWNPLFDKSKLTPEEIEAIETWMNGAADAEGNRTGGKNAELKTAYKNKDSKTVRAIKDAYHSSGYQSVYYKDEVTGLPQYDEAEYDYQTPTAKDLIKDNVNTYAANVSQIKQNNEENEKLLPQSDSKYDTTDIDQKLKNLERDYENGIKTYSKYLEERNGYYKQLIDSQERYAYDLYQNSQYKDYVKPIIEERVDEKGNIYKVVVGIEGVMDAYYKLGEEQRDEIDAFIDTIDGIAQTTDEMKDIMRDPDFKDDPEGTADRKTAAEKRAEYQQNEAELWNNKNDQAELEEDRYNLSRLEGVVGQLSLPQEIQTALGMGFTAAEMGYEAKEIVNLNSEYASLDDNRKLAEESKEYVGSKSEVMEGDDKYKVYYFDPTTGQYEVNAEKVADLTPEEWARVQEEMADLNSKYADRMRTILRELSGGIVQKGIRTLGTSLTSLSKAFKKEEDGTYNVSDALDDLEAALGLASGSLDGFEGALTKIVEGAGKVKLKGLGMNSEQLSPLTSFFKDNKMENVGNLFSMVLGEGGFTGADLLGSASGAMGQMLELGSGFMNWDMITGGVEMFTQGIALGQQIYDRIKQGIEKIKQVIEQVIQYISQATQVLVDAWTNREDYLYNYLKLIEKHLQEYEKLQRYSTQIQKGRIASADDIAKNWEDQWASLQKQLEEQTERLETRQQELDRSRWNPFMLISGWDPLSDTLYENREVKMLWDIIIGLGEAFAPLGTGTFFSQLNQLYEDYDQRVQQSYEDRLAAEQALLDIEDERLELVKFGADETTQFEDKVLQALIQKEQEAIDELSRLNEAVTTANQKLMSTLQDNLSKIRQDRENEKKEEELGEKERRLAYLRQDTSGANTMEIKRLEKELDEQHEDYTDTLIDQKISELEKQNELAAEQRQQQIDLLQGQLDYAEKYGLYWETIYDMLYSIDENGKVVINADNFDVDGNIRENSQLAQLLGTHSDRMGMSTWQSVLDNEETKLLGLYYKFFMTSNGADGNWEKYWALLNPGGNDPNYTREMQEIPDGLLGVLYKLEIGIREYFGTSNPGLINMGRSAEQGLKNFFGKLFNYEPWETFKAEEFNKAYVEAETIGGIHQGLVNLGNKIEDGWNNFFGLNQKAAQTGRQTTEKAKSNNNNYGTQNYGAVTENYNFNIGTVGENISLDDMVDKVTSAIKGLFTGNINSYKKSQ